MVLTLFIVDDAKGNRLLALYTGDENKIIADSEYSQLTSSLVIVKSPQGFMLLKNKYRNEWELAGGMIDDGESPRECAIRECFEESGYTISDLRFIGMMKFFLQPSYHLTKERIEYTTLYCADILQVQKFEETEEMADLCWYNIGEEIENASRIDIKLLEYYRP